jgi:hypothetical protein
MIVEQSALLIAEQLAQNQPTGPTHSEAEHIIHNTVRRNIQAGCLGELCEGDTCRINKKSSAELSEAINSMYAFYNQATICYVYPYDVGSSKDFE